MDNLNDPIKPELEAKKASGDKDTWWDLVKFALTIIVIIVPFRLFIAQPFIVHGASMDPTFSDRDYLIVDEISYRLREPARGEVAIFRYPFEPSKYFIKRIIGLPGETVIIRRGRVTVRNADEMITLDEPYLGSEETGDVYKKLSETEYFVMGDNRAQSYDSRAWGPLDEKYLKGRAFLRLFPPTKIDYLPGSHHFTESSDT